VTQSFWRVILDDSNETNDQFTIGSQLLMDASQRPGSTPPCCGGSAASSEDIRTSIAENFVREVTCGSVKVTNADSTGPFKPGTVRNLRAKMRNSALELTFTSALDASGMKIFYC